MFHSLDVGFPMLHSNQGERTIIYEIKIFNWNEMFVFIDKTYLQIK